MAMAMKRIRIEIPIEWEEFSRGILPNEIWLKVLKNHTEAFRNQKLTKRILLPEKKFSLEVEVDESLKLIKVHQPTPLNLADSICLEWSRNISKSDWRISELKKVYVFDNITIHDVKVIDGRPDLEGWKKYIKEKDDMFLFLKTWALVVYEMENECIGEIHFKDMNE